MQAGCTRDCREVRENKESPRALDDIMPRLTLAVISELGGADVRRLETLNAAGKGEFGILQCVSEPRCMTRLGALPA